MGSGKLGRPASPCILQLHDGDIWQDAAFLVNEEMSCCDCSDVAPCIVQIISEIVESCRSHDFTDIIMVHEHRGEPDGLVVCHLPYGPTAYFGIYNTVRLRTWKACT